MKAFATKLHEVSVLSVFVLVLSSCFGFIRDIITDGVLFFLGEQVGNFTRVEQVVDIFEEGLSDNLGVREEELYFLVFNTALLEQFFDVLVPFLFTVVLGNFNTKCGKFVDAGAESGHGGATRTTHTDKHGIATLLAQDTRDLGQVLNAVLEEHKVHGLVISVVQTE